MLAELSVSQDVRSKPWQGADIAVYALICMHTARPVLAVACSPRIQQPRTSARTIEVGAY